MKTLSLQIDHPVSISSNPNCCRAFSDDGTSLLCSHLEYDDGGGYCDPTNHCKLFGANLGLAGLNINGLLVAQKCPECKELTAKMIFKKIKNKPYPNYPKIELETYD